MRKWKELLIKKGDKTRRIRRGTDEKWNKERWKNNGKKGDKEEEEITGRKRWLKRGRIRKKNINENTDENGIGWNVREQKENINKRR